MHSPSCGRCSCSFRCRARRSAAAADSTAPEIAEMLQGPSGVGTWVKHGKTVRHSRMCLSCCATLPPTNMATDWGSLQKEINLPGTSPQVGSSKQFFFILPFVGGLSTSTMARHDQKLQAHVQGRAYANVILWVRLFLRVPVQPDISRKTMRFTGPPLRQTHARESLQGSLMSRLPSPFPGGKTINIANHRKAQLGVQFL